MNLQTAEYTFTLLTPCFCGGADNQRGHAEMRVPSIRGLLREWHRASRKQPSEDEVWGVATSASKVAVELQVPIATVQANGATLLPHKEKGKQGPRPALHENQEFTLLLRRLVGCSDAHWKTANEVVRLWLLLGCLGARSNRAAGSVWPVNPAPPADLIAFSRELQKLTLPPAWRITVLRKAYANSLDLRYDASLTHGKDVTIFGGIKPKRQPSPFKVKAIALGESLHLLLFAPTATVLDAARKYMVNEPMGGREACDTIWPATS